MDAFLENIMSDEARIIRCAPHPRRWERFSNRHELAWTSVPFVRGGANIVPDTAGFYCFVVANAIGHLPAVFYPLYAGETEDLRRRYGDYLREKSSSRGRIHVRKFLNVFAGEVAFAFAPYVSEKSARLSVEKELNDALMPPYSKKDFSAEVKGPMGAWQ